MFRCRTCNPEHSPSYERILRSGPLQYRRNAFFVRGNAFSNNEGASRLLQVSQTFFCE